MLYIIFTFAGLLYLSTGQSCSYGSNKLFKKNRGAEEFERKGGQQYVVYDFSQLGAVRGEYFLPFTFTDEDGSLVCHSSGFSALTKIQFECSTGYKDSSEDATTTIYAHKYNTGSCSGTPESTVWWEKGWSPFIDPTNGAVTTMDQCDTVAMCQMNYTRSELTQYTGSRFDFSCEGEVEYTKATLCILDPQEECNTGTCSTIYAALGAGCIATPNSTFANLLVSCDEKKAFLTTYVDLVAAKSASEMMTPWNTYTVDRTCPNDGTSGYVCNTYKVGKKCAKTFDTTINGEVVDVTGKVEECTAPFKSAGSAVNYSFALLLISGYISLMQF